MMPIQECAKAMISWGWTIELDSARTVNKANIKRKMSKLSLVKYHLHLPIP